MSDKITRRTFIEKSGQSALWGGAVLAGATARSALAVPGANDRIRIGMIGCGIRTRGMTMREMPDEPKQHNIEVAACCDVWKQQVETRAALIKEKHGNDPKIYRDYRKVLDDPNIDAVVIATPDHQHCTMLIDAVKAGKDVYIEKPIAMNMKELNAAYDAVKASKAVVQHGTQGRSSRGASAARDFVQSGKLGKILRVEECRSFYYPYWNGQPDGPEKESDTDWKAFLFNRPDRPYDRDQHGHWMGYRDFSTGPVGGWMSHFSDLTHFITGCGLPVAAVAQGGIYSPTSVKPRDCPDTITGILEYAEGFTTCYTTHFGNAANTYRMFFGSKGVLNFSSPEGGRDRDIAPVVSGQGSKHPDKIKGKKRLESGQYEHHLTNWIRCIRERKQPIADMEAGYAHGVAVLLVDRAYVEGRKMVFDRERREIRPA